MSSLVAMRISLVSKSTKTEQIRILKNRIATVTRVSAAREAISVALFPRSELDALDQNLASSLLIGSLKSRGQDTTEDFELTDKRPAKLPDNHRFLPAVGDLCVTYRAVTPISAVGSFFVQRTVDEAPLLKIQFRGFYVPWAGEVVASGGKSC
ncbi:MAG: hypothetical protein AAGD04_10515 [Pseudomonadota bacterium]